MNRRDFLLGAGAVALTPTLLKAQVDPSICGPQVGIQAGLVPGGEVWLSAERGDGGEVRANRRRLGPWETWQMVPVGYRNVHLPNPSIEGYWRFITGDGRWVLESDHASHILMANRNCLSHGSEFLLTWLGGQDYHISGIHGFWSLAEDGTTYIVADYSAPNNALSRFGLWGG